MDRNYIHIIAPFQNLIWHLAFGILGRFTQKCLCTSFLGFSFFFSSNNLENIENNHYFCDVLSTMHRHLFAQSLLELVN